MGPLGHLPRHGALDNHFRQTPESPEMSERQGGSGAGLPRR